MICKPKQSGGLGIVNFQKQNAALLIKFLHKFYSKEVPWVELIWYAHYRGKILHSGGEMFLNLWIISEEWLQLKWAREIRFYFGQIIGF
jgi:hypothetical protein